MHSIQQFRKPCIQAKPVVEHFNLNFKHPAKLQFQFVETIRADPTMESTTNLLDFDPQNILEPNGMNIFV